MKLSKSVVRIIAVLLVAVMAAGAAGCVSSYRNNPVVAKVGSVNLTLDQYMTLFNDTNSDYYKMLQYGYITGEQYANYILNNLVTYGVQLDQTKVQNLTLTPEEEDQLQKDVDSEIKGYLESTYASKIHSSITDATEKYNAMLDLLKKDLKKEKKDFDTYRKGVEDSLRNTALIEKLQENTVAGVNIDNEDVKKYFEDNVKTDVTVASFNSSWQSFITRSSNLPPFYMPHPEKAVEDDPETTDKDESKPAEDDGAIFSVQHVLMKFKETAPDTETDLPSYASKDEELIAKMKDFEKTLSSLTKEQFLEKCHDKEICDDPGMLQPSIQYFGYMMQKSLIDSYFAGFGYASMKLKFGEDWEPETKEDESKDKDSSTTPKYLVWFFNLADGGKVAKVFTTSGIHYIIVNPNEECYNIYDDEGYLMLPMYKDGELVKDSEGIVTATGHMTQAQLDTMNTILENCKATIEIKDDEKETEENTDPDATPDPNATEEPQETPDPNATEEPQETPDPNAEADADNDETEEEVVMTAQLLYDNCFDAKLKADQAELYTQKLKEWTDSTKIKTYKNLIKTLYKA